MYVQEVGIVLIYSRVPNLLRYFPILLFHILVDIMRIKRQVKRWRKIYVNVTRFIVDIEFGIKEAIWLSYMLYVAGLGHWPKGDAPFRRYGFNDFSHSGHVDEAGKSVVDC